MEELSFLDPGRLTVDGLLLAAVVALWRANKALLREKDRLINILLRHQMRREDSSTP